MSAATAARALTRRVRRRWRNRSPFSWAERLDPRLCTLTIPDRPVPTDTARKHLATPLEAADALARAQRRRAAGRPVRWRTRRPRTAGVPVVADDVRWPRFDWPEHPRVLAVVPHFANERWLAECLESLAAQTRALDGIVVVDDASDQPPTEIVDRFASVTLVTAAERSGPFGLVQAVIDATDHDAYLIQDADDWCTIDRFDRQLAMARATGAEYVGTQELRVFDDDQRIELWGHPLDGNAALDQGPTHALLHGTSLVTRSLVTRVGGFASGLRFGADTEFLYRAALAGRVVSTPDFLYFRRVHGRSLTQAPATGSGSPARIEVAERIEEAARDRAASLVAGAKPDLTPLARAEPVTLRHVTGPRLVPRSRPPNRP